MTHAHHASDRRTTDGIGDDGATRTRPPSDGILVNAHLAATPPARRPIAPLARRVWSAAPAPSDATTTAHAHPATRPSDVPRAAAKRAATTAKTAVGQTSAPPDSTDSAATSATATTQGTRRRQGSAVRGVVEAGMRG